MNIKFLFTIFFVLLVSNAFAQTKTLILPRQHTAPPPGNMKLLSGYIYKPDFAIDAVVGTISKENGIQIEYSSGLNMGNFAMEILYREKRNVAWEKNQQVNDKNLDIVYLNNGKIYATFNEKTNFTSTVKTNEELSDFLLMIMTYGSKDSPQKEENKSKKQ